MQKEQIIQAAVTILDQEGLEGVSLRRLATELNVKAASIYWHIANKQVLLDEMANFILDEQFGNLDFANVQYQWEDWLDSFAHRLRAAMLSHRDGGRVVAGAHIGITITLARLMDLSVRILRQAGFNQSKSLIITMTIINFTFGFVIEEQASPTLDSPPINAVEAVLPVEILPFFMAALSDGEYKNSQFNFDSSIRIIINGVHAELTQTSFN